MWASATRILPTSHPPMHITKLFSKAKSPKSPFPRKRGPRVSPESTTPFPLPTIASAEHARHVIDIIEAGYRAAETGQTQELRTTFEPLPIEAL